MSDKAAGDIYERLSFGPLPCDRPYAVINMVATIDGKTVSGDLDETVVDLGSKNDHILMRRIESAVDAVVLGANTLRATSSNWQPRAPIRVVVTQSGSINFDSAFFKGQSYVGTSQTAAFKTPTTVGILRAGETRLDPHELLRILRSQLGVERLLILGGSEINALFLAKNLVDELFLTIAPKVKLGRDVPTYAGGKALSREKMLNFDLIEHHQIDGELFLRYRRKELS